MKIFRGEAVVLTASISEIPDEFRKVVIRIEMSRFMDEVYLITYDCEGQCILRIAAQFSDELYREPGAEDADYVP